MSGNRTGHREEDVEILVIEAEAMEERGGRWRELGSAGVKEKESCAFT